MSEKGYNYDTEFWGEPAPKRGRGPRGGKKEKKSSRALLWLLILLVFFIGFMYAGYRLSESWLGGGIFPEQEQSGGDDAPGAVAGDRVMRLLLVGVDRRDQEASRSDTIIVAFINVDKHQVNLLSIPRDTYTGVPGHGKTKINHAHAYGGRDLLVTSVESLLGIDIDRYVEADFQGFANIVDLLGGVEIDIPQDMIYKEENIDIKKGLQTLDGEDALGYVRYRSDGRGDIGRVERQQQFLRLLMDQALRVRTLWKLPELVQELHDNVQTDLSFKDMLFLATEMKDIKSENLDAATLPGEPRDIEEINYWMPDYTAMEDIISKFQSAQAPAETGNENSP